MGVSKPYLTSYQIVSICLFTILLLTVVPAVQGETYIDQLTGMELIRVKGGCYIIGDTFDKGRDDERPNKEVCIDDFYLGKYEVTQIQWATIIGKNPSYFQKDVHQIFCGLRFCVGCPENVCGFIDLSKFPVENVSWDDIQEFLEKINNRTGKDYRLPTEAEWEYAARSGGNKEKWAGTHFELELDKYAWYRDTSGYRTQPVGQMKPNGLGLYDMTGNVWEWVNDWYDADYYKTIKKNNPEGPKTGVYRVMRGGSWFEDPWVIRTSYRNSGFPYLRSTNVGFRLAMSAPKPPPPIEEPPPKKPMEVTILEKGRITLDIHFDFDKWNIKLKYHEEIKRFAEVMKKYPDMKVQIEGHTCIIGGAKYNLRLSQRRADSVRKYLIQKFGIEPSRLTAKGYGLSRPIASNKTAEGRKQNRRIEGVAEYTITKTKPY
ncbi:MAG: SUMF1/EgtB/PvdO family nonheme iron enzyme [Proteobacteria bacterium]|nr:SUMF1/EgtB/PvdO family nonheme iron enzyme [Pseudomonadota bacterium]